jgi:hypothetical protein
VHQYGWRSADESVISAIKRIFGEKNESYFNGRHVWCNNEEKIALNKGVLMLAQGGPFQRA